MSVGTTHAQRVIEATMIAGNVDAIVRVLQERDDVIAELRRRLDVEAGQVGPALKVGDAVTFDNVDRVPVGAVVEWNAYGVRGSATRKGPDAWLVGSVGTWTWDDDKVIRGPVPYIVAMAGAS
jgi:hypothetical protein